MTEPSRPPATSRKTLAIAGVALFGGIVIGAAALGSRSTEKPAVFTAPHPADADASSVRITPISEPPPVIVPPWPPSSPSTIVIDAAIEPTIAPDARAKAGTAMIGGPIDAGAPSAADAPSPDAAQPEPEPTITVDGGVELEITPAVETNVRPATTPAPRKPPPPAPKKPALNDRDKILNPYALKPSPR